MSADAWSRCPFCVADARAAFDARNAEVVAAYGTVPPEEFLEMVKSVPEEFDPMSVEPTLRQDWEMGLGESEVDNFEPMVNYRATCRTCGATVRVDTTCTLTRP